MKLSFDKKEKKREKKRDNNNNNNNSHYHNNSHSTSPPLLSSSPSSHFQQLNNFIKRNNFFGGGGGGSKKPQDKYHSNPGPRDKTNDAAAGHGTSSQEEQARFDYDSPYRQQQWAAFPVLKLDRGGFKPKEVLVRERHKEVEEQEPPTIDGDTGTRISFHYEPKIHAHTDIVILYCLSSSTLSPFRSNAKWQRCMHVQHIIRMGIRQKTAKGQSNRRFLFVINQRLGMHRSITCTGRWRWLGRACSARCRVGCQDMQRIHPTGTSTSTA